MTSPVVAFGSLFLGLITGVQPVDLLVRDDVATVLLEIDGLSCGATHAPPWSVECDFGAELAPHLLEVVAHDAAGAELGRERQWLNLPRQPAEASVVLDTAADGTPQAARLSWRNILGSEPTAIRVQLDGRQLAVGDPEKIPLPAVDLRQVHFLRAEIEFADGLGAEVEITFGGTYSDQIARQLTAVPLDAARPGKLPPASGWGGWLVSRGEALEVVALEEGPAEVVMVRDLTSQEAIDAQGREWRQRLGRTRGIFTGSSPDTLRFLARLKAEQQIRFLFPVALRTDSSILFPRTGAFGPEDAGLHWLLTYVRPPAAGSGQQIADAVAVAGMNAAGRNRRRAVVLLLGPAGDDRSQYTPTQVRHYLDRLHVPLVVWTTAPDDWRGETHWGVVEDVSDLGKLERASGRLARSLDRQRVVWVEGLHLPQEIDLSQPASEAGLTLVTDRR